jgi:hypothetical protein
MAFTLAQLRDFIETDLKDSANATFSTDEIDRAVALALADFNDVYPDEAITTVAAVDDQHEYDISTITGLVSIVKVVYPYLASDPDYPMAEVVPEVFADTLIMPGTCSMDATYSIRIFYTKHHTINGLESETSTTIPDELRDILALGATAYCAKMYSRFSINRINRSSWTQRQWTEYWKQAERMFKEELGRLRSRRLYQVRPAGPQGWEA